MNFRPHYMYIYVLVELKFNIFRLFIRSSLLVSTSKTYNFQSTCYFSQITVELNY